MGVLLCWGSPELKSRVLYNCIQTHIQEFIVPNERMEEILSFCIRCSAILLVKHACKDLQEPDYSRAELPLEMLDEDLVEEVREDFLESVYGTESKMHRTLFLAKLQSEENRWIMDPELLRQRVKKHLRKRDKGIDILD